MEVTTIKLRTNTKSKLDHFREYRNESYDELIQKMIFIVNTLKKKPKLSIEAVEAIEKARKRIKQGNFVTEKDARQRLGL